MLIILLIVGIALIFYEVDKVCYEFEQKAKLDRRLNRRLEISRDRRSCGIN